MPEAAVRHVDHVGPDLPEPLVRETEARQHSGGEIFGDDVGAGHDLGEELPTALRAQVQGDRQLLDVVVLEATAELAPTALVDERLHPPEDVPATFGDRVLDLDDLRPERGQRAGRPGTGELAGEVADPQVREHAHQGATYPRHPVLG